MNRNFFIPFLLAILISGCEEKHENVFISQQSTEEIRNYDLFKENFSKYWQAYSEKRYADMYSMELPYLKFLKTEDWYLKFRDGDHSDFNVTLLAIEASKKCVDVAYVTYRLDTSKFSKTLKDKWIYVDTAERTNWWHAYYPSLLPPPPGSF